jgi:hypothetical protein
VIVNKFGLILVPRSAGLARLEEMRIQFDGGRPPFAAKSL